MLQDTFFYVFNVCKCTAGINSTESCRISGLVQKSHFLYEKCSLLTLRDSSVAATSRHQHRFHHRSLQMSARCSSVIITHLHEIRKDFLLPVAWIPTGSWKKKKGKKEKDCISQKKLSYKFDINWRVFTHFSGLLFTPCIFIQLWWPLPCSSEDTTVPKSYRNQLHLGNNFLLC